MIAPARRVAALPRSATVTLTDRVSDLLRAGRPILGLAGGDPDFDTPAHVTEAAVASLRAGRTHYGPSAGLSELRAAIAADLAARGVPRDPATDVVVTSSGKYALSMAFEAILDFRDEVIVPDPGWVSYAPLVELHGGVVVPASSDPASYVTPRTRAVLVNSPNNPTGAVLTDAQMQSLAGLARDRDLVIVSDEIYRHLSFVGPVATPATYAPERTIVVDGASKAYAMTGWRLGWLSAPTALTAAVLTIQQHTISCAPTFVQDAGVAALTGPQDDVVKMAAAYRARRDRAVAALEVLPGLRVTPPDGAFYLWVDITGTGRDSQEFASWLLEAAGVAVVPGVSFGAAGEGYVRLSLAVGDDVVDTALAAIATAIAN